MSVGPHWTPPLGSLSNGVRCDSQLLRANAIPGHGGAPFSSAAGFSQCGRACSIMPASTSSAQRASSSLRSRSSTSAISSAVVGIEGRRPDLARYVTPKGDYAAVDTHVGIR